MTLATTTHGASHLRVLRVLRRGDRHDLRDLTVSIRLEGDFRQPYQSRPPAGAIPPATLETFVHGALRAAGDAEIEAIGLAICRDLFSSYRQLSRVRVEIAEQPWTRPDIGGRPQGQCFLFGGAERRMVTVTSNGVQTSVVSGIDDLTLMRTAGFLAAPAGRADNGTDDAVQALIVGSLAARWTYHDPQVTFGPYRRGVRTIIVETFAMHAARSIDYTLQAIGEAIVDAYQEIRDVTLTMAEHPCRPVDPMAGPAPDVDDLVVIGNTPLAVVDVHVERR
jgi:urate oxidase